MNKLIHKITLINRLFLSFSVLTFIINYHVLIRIGLVLIVVFNLFHIISSIVLLFCKKELSKKIQRSLLVYLITISTCFFTILIFNDSKFYFSELLLLIPFFLIIGFSFFIEKIYELTENKISIKLNKVLIIAWLNRIMFSLTIVFFIIGVINANFKNKEYNNVEYLFYGMMMMFVLGVFQILVGIIASFYYNEVLGKNGRMLKVYTKAVIFYVIFFIIGGVILYFLKSYDYLLYNDLDIEDTLVTFYVIICPILIASYFTLYLETLNKEDKFVV